MVLFDVLADRTGGIFLTLETSVMASQTQSTTFASRSGKWLALLCLLILSTCLCGPHLIAQDQSNLAGAQDNWGAAGRKLAIPSSAANKVRKSITISKHGIYVTSGELNYFAYQNCIEQYDLGGVFVRTWTVDPVSEYSKTDLGSLASDIDGNIYTVDVSGYRVFKFSKDGASLQSMGTTPPYGLSGAGDGQFSWWMSASGSREYNSVLFQSSASNLIGIDSNKNIYICDPGNSRIQVFDSNFKFVAKFGSGGSGIDQFHDRPIGLLVTPDDGILVYERFTGMVDNLLKVSVSILQFDASRNFVKRMSYHGSSQFSYESNQILAQTPEGQLIFGENHSNAYNPKSGKFESFWSISGYDIKTLAKTFSFREGNAFNPSYSLFAALSAACDAQGNLWMVRPDRVECLERQMRFDLHKPTKALPLPSVLNVSQSAGSKTVDIDFRVVDNDSSTVETGLVALVGGPRSWSNLVVPKTFNVMTPVSGTLAYGGTLVSGTLSTGSFASTVSTGKAYRVSWNAVADMPGVNFASLSFGVIARDARPEIGVHYVTIPADASNGTSLKISSKPVQEDDLSDLWMWLLARRDPRVAVSGNSVSLTAAGESFISGALLPTTSWKAQINYANYPYGPYGSSPVPTPSIPGVVHDGSLTTVQGRAFAYKLINCRPVTAAEKTRALAGRFNISSVDDNSVVSLEP